MHARLGVMELDDRDFTEAVRIVRLKPRRAYPGRRRGNSRSGQAHPARLIYQTYEAVAEAAGREPVHAVRFGQELSARGFCRHKTWDHKRAQMVAGWIL